MFTRGTSTSRASSAKGRRSVSCFLFDSPKPVALKAPPPHDRLSAGGVVGGILSSTAVTHLVRPILYRPAYRWSEGGPNERESPSRHTAKDRPSIQCRTDSR